MKLFPLAIVAAIPSFLHAQDVQLQVAADPAEAAIVGEAPFLADRVIVRFQGATDLAAAARALDGERYVVAERLVPALDLYLVAIQDGTRVADAIADLQARAGIRYASPDGYVELRDTIPNDPSFGSQWCHVNMQSAKAWDLGTGSTDFVISVVDGGCMLTHEDIAPNLWHNVAEVAGIPGVDDDGNGYVDDKHGWDAYQSDGTIPNDGHGTHTNGIAGARGNNGLGVAGVSWTTSLMPVAGASGSTSTVSKAYNYIYTQKNLWLQTAGAKGANVVVTSNSFGIDKGNCLTTYKAWDDLYELLGSVGILSCGATANASWDIDVVQDTPTGCSTPYMVSVTNTTSSDVKSSGAAWGLTTIDLGAPGTSIYSTYSNGGYTNMSGTSMATPQVAGAIALLHSVASPKFAALRASDPAQAALVLKEMILRHVDPLSSLQGKTVSGGRLNVFQAATAMSQWNAGGTDGTIVAYGTDLGGANIGTLDSTSTPNIGTTVTLDASGFTQSSALLLILSSAELSLPLFGGTVLIDFSQSLADQLYPVVGGDAAMPVAIPPHPALVGLVAYAQCGGIDPTLAEGAAMSNGLIITVGE